MKERAVEAHGVRCSRDANMPTAAAATKNDTGFPAREIRYEFRFRFMGWKAHATPKSS